MWSHRKAGLGLISSLIIVAGTALPVMGQDTPPPPPEPETAPGQTPPNHNDPDAERQRIENAQRLRDRLRQQRIDEQRLKAEQEAQGLAEDPNVPPAQPVIGVLPPAPAEGQISLNFEGPVDLSAFVEFVAQTLQINIIEDQGLAGKSVTFRAPLTIPREELLPLLQALIEDSGFALVYDDLGFFRVRAEAGIEPNFSGGDLATTRIIRTPLVRPSVAAQTLTSQIGGGGGQGGVPGATAGMNFRITPIDELGILIATGPSGTLEMIEQFTKELVAESQDQKFTRLDLRNVSASYARARVIALNAGVGAGQSSVALNQGGGQPTPTAATGLLGNLESRLYLDQGNALLFRGSEEEASLIRDMIAVLDEVTPLIVRRYVAGSVALEAANAGERLGLGSVNITGEGGGQYNRGGGMTFSPTGTRMGGETGVEPAASGFTVDTSTGSLVYYGTESQHDRVQALVEQFKLTAIGEDIEIKTYKLLYAKAEGEEDGAAGVVDILMSLLEDPSQQTTRSQFLPGTSPSSTNFDQQTPAELIQTTESTPPTEGATRLLATEQNTIIVGDPARNQVIIKAPRKAQEQFAEIIAKLDQKQPQVQIEVKIVAVTTTDNFNWEADVQLNFGQFSWFSGFGASIVEGAAAAGATTLDPRTLPATTPGLTTGWIKSDYLPIAIQTLETIGDTHVLSNPRVLVNDNQKAEFESIREVPYSASSQGTSTTITSQGGTAEAGTTLEVTPRISTGGDITVDYSVELSDFTGPGVGGLQPPAQRDKYKSFVTLPSDSTIVVGGFRLKRDEKTENRIPVLGQNPVIGNLFKNYTNNKTNAVIFVFITPRIMRDPLGEDLRLATRGPMAELNVDPDVPDMKPSVIPIFGDLGPTIVPFNPTPPAAATMSDSR